MFNPRPRIDIVPLQGDASCYVIDDALLEPERLRAYAVAERARFAPAPRNAYPGIELRMPESFSERLNAFFIAHIRARLGARRVLRMYSRLSLVTLRPQELQPGQRFCHRDQLGFAPGQRIGASVLYLFEDAALGGTSFYAPRRPSAELAQMSCDAARLPADAFDAKYDVPQGYMSGSNAYFEQVASVPAKWNRLIFYDGGLLHSGDIAHPQRLDADPMRGRLTLNGFFVCSPALV